MSVQFTVSPELQRTLQRLERIPVEQMVAFTSSMIVEQTRARISDEKTSPDGTPWQDWSENYKKRREPQHSLLQSTDALLNSITDNVMGEQSQIVANEVYAAAQHFGHNHIPARPFMGISTDNYEEIFASLNRWMDNYLTS